MDHPGSSIENNSFENILLWWETKELTSDIADDPDMEFEIHIEELAAEIETVTWNVKKENDSDGTKIMSNGFKEKNANERS